MVKRSSRTLWSLTKPEPGAGDDVDRAAVAVVPVEDVALDAVAGAAVVRDVDGPAAVVGDDHGIVPVSPTHGPVRSKRKEPVRRRRWAIVLAQLASDVQSIHDDVGEM